MLNNLRRLRQITALIWKLQAGHGMVGYGGLLSCVPSAHTCVNYHALAIVCLIINACRVLSVFVHVSKRATFCADAQVRKGVGHGNPLARETLKRPLTHWFPNWFQKCRRFNGNVQLVFNCYIVVPHIRWDWQHPHH